MKKRASVRKIEDFLKNLTFEKTLLGANQADVYACLKDVSAMYEDVIADMELEREEESKEWKRQLGEKDQRIEELIQQAAERPRTISDPEDEQMISSLKKKLKEAMTHQEEYRNRTEVLLRSIEEQQKERDDRRVRAEREARMIVADAKEQARQILKEAQDQIQEEYLRTQKSMEEANRIRRSMQDSLRMISSDLSTMFTQVEGLRGKVADLPDFSDSSPAEEMTNSVRIIEADRDKHGFAI